MKNINLASIALVVVETPASVRADLDFRDISLRWSWDLRSLGTKVQKGAYSA